MRNGLQRTIARWVEAGRKIGFLLLLAAGSAALGFLIAWPLWLYATSARRAYTYTVLGLAAAGVVFLIVRSVQKSRTEIRDPGTPRRTFISTLLTVLMALVGFGGAYLGAAFLVRGLWIFGTIDAAAWALLLWLLGRARRAVKIRKLRSIPAEHRNE